MQIRHAFSRRYTPVVCMFQTAISALKLVYCWQPRTKMPLSKREPSRDKSVDQIEGRKERALDMIQQIE